MKRNISHIEEQKSAGEFNKKRKGEPKVDLSVSNLPLEILLSISEFTPTSLFITTFCWINKEMKEKFSKLWSSFRTLLLTDMEKKNSFKDKLFLEAITGMFINCTHIDVYLPIDFGDNVNNNAMIVITKKKILWFYFKLKLTKDKEKFEDIEGIDPKMMYYIKSHYFEKTKLLDFAPVDFRKDPKKILLKKQNFKFASVEMLESKDFVCNALETDHLLCNYPMDCMTNLTFILLATLHNPKVYSQLSIKYKENPDVIANTVKSGGFEFIPSNVANYMDIAKSAIRLSRTNYKYLPHFLRENKEVLLFTLDFEIGKLNLTDIPKSLVLDENIFTKIHDSNILNYVNENEFDYIPDSHLEKNNILEKIIRQVVINEVKFPAHKFDHIFDDYHKVKYLLKSGLPIFLIISDRLYENEIFEFIYIISNEVLDDRDKTMLVMDLLYSLESRVTKITDKNIKGAKKMARKCLYKILSVTKLTTADRDDIFDFLTIVHQNCLKGEDSDS